MSGDKHHFGSLVKDDFKRFFFTGEPLSTLPTSTHGCWVSSERQGYLLIRSAFQPSTVFQRYPDILVWKRVTYQQFNYNIELNITVIFCKNIKIT